MGQSGAVAIVTAHLWRLDTGRMPAAFASVARDPRRVRSLPGVHFAKLLGTSANFRPTGTDLRRWLLLTCWTSERAARDFEQDPVIRAWRERCLESWSALLAPISSRGQWSGREPFGEPGAAPAAGLQVAITRARLVARRAVPFWRASGPVAAELADSPGLRLAFGMGEAPIGIQGTFSLWDDSASLTRFAYHRSAHRGAIEQTAELGWYSEQLFARLRVIESAGTVDGANPVAA